LFWIFFSKKHQNYRFRVGDEFLEKRFINKFYLEVGIYDKKKPWN